MKILFHRWSVLSNFCWLRVMIMDKYNTGQVKHFQTINVRSSCGVWKSDILLWFMIFLKPIRILSNKETHFYDGKIPNCQTSLCHMDDIRTDCRQSTSTDPTAGPQLSLIEITPFIPFTAICRVWCPNVTFCVNINYF
jgi:hypothetical protein